jgi:hypothetical protein
MKSGLIPVVLAMLALAACNGEIYVRDGVTDGDTFFLAERALSDGDPAYQSWVRYSLARSTCQLELGGDNPARGNSYDCELIARRLLADSWRENAGPVDEDAYLDDLLTVDEAGFLDEHVAQEFGRRQWTLPDDLDLRAYRRWKRQMLPGHDPETRITGSWNYARRVSAR